MSEKEMLTKKFIMVDMDDAKMSTSERPIIGTQALATCLGVLLYDEVGRQAIVAHVSSEPIKALDKIFNIIIENKLLKVKFKYKIIWGTDREPAEFHHVVDILEKHFSDFIPFGENELSEGGIRTDENTMSRKFAFDALTGKFVTDKVLFGTDYYVVNGYDDTNDFNTSMHR